MKILSLKKSALLGICGMIVLQFACSSDDDLKTADLLIGTWTTSNVVVDATVEGQSVVDYLVDVVGMTAEDAATQNSLFEAALRSEVTGSLTLNADNTYTSNFGGGSDSGTWSLSDDRKTLTLYEGTDVIIITINSVTGSSLNVTISDEILQDLDGDPNTPDESILAEATITLTK